MTREFAAMVRGDHPDVAQYRRYVLAELRCALIRARCLMHEIKTIGIALSGGVIDEDMALGWLADARALDFLNPTEPPWSREDAQENTDRHSSAENSGDGQGDQTARREGVRVGAEESGGILR